MKYAWITEYRDSFPVSIMCQVLRVSSSGYYDSLDRKPSKRAQRHERIKQSVQQVYTKSNSIYGSAMIAERLQKRDDLESACRNTVATAMQELGIESRVSKSFTPTTTMTGHRCLGRRRSRRPTTLYTSCSQNVSKTDESVGRFEVP